MTPAGTFRRNRDSVVDLPSQDEHRQKTPGDPLTVVRGQLHFGQMNIWPYLLLPWQNVLMRITKSKENRRVLCAIDQCFAWKSNRYNMELYYFPTIGISAVDHEANGEYRVATTFLFNDRVEGIPDICACQGLCGGCKKLIPRLIQEARIWH